MNKKDKVDKLEKEFNPKKYLILELCQEEGTGFDAINDQNREAFYPLLFGIEEIIYLNYLNNPSRVLSLNRYDKRDVSLSLSKILNSVKNATSNSENNKR